ncbi:hypothetical protein H6F93_18460 [Leptolyngbya sp. FACHB-671]|uniref:hypothetical protein n=1 Tax=Leptolyngbya sp. FACHB-671 TaxID=2692812 RepID=UPI0019AA5732|nr:hypothetical protein [Leptolyngbya sp. FACHB-671]MBD1868264.1 hypothetical protein [Cyanobacteria bacterium FACHB-471]MBD2069481.1 hypothetical protein [Leptolyngbya sp. FACHB-671]
MRRSKGLLAGENAQKNMAMGINIRVFTTNYKFHQMSKYLNLVQEAFSQHLDEIEKVYEEEISREMEEEEYYFLKDHYTDKFIEMERDLPDLLLSSFVITWYSFVEQQLEDICKSFETDISAPENIKHDKGIRRSRKILLTIAKYEINSADWQELVKIGGLRNLLVHTGNRLNGSLFRSTGKEISLVSEVGNTYYFSIEPSFLSYLKKHKLLEHTGFSLNIFPTFSYCDYLVEFGRSLLIRLYSDLDIK